MEEINLGKNIIRLRHNIGMTQEELAEHMGVSKSAVSKWETSTTYPDILLLPQLATLFNATVDELLGYCPQLTKTAIRKIYYELTEEISQGNKQTAFEKCDEYVKKYYSCFAFLHQMAVFYINHLDLAENREENIEKAIELCKRIEKESKDISLVKDTAMLEATILLMANRPSDALLLLGEEIRPVRQEAELIANAFRLLGNMEKAKEITEINFYQYLLLLLGNGSIYLMMNNDNLEIIEETVKRLEGVIQLFQVEYLHANVSFQFYITAAQVYAMHGINDKALNMLGKYADTYKNSTLDLHGDDYFTSVEMWLKNLELGTKPPRNMKLIKSAIISAVKDNPAFDGLKEEKRFIAILDSLKV